jgi:hypothetical protein
MPMEMDRLLDDFVPRPSLRRRIVRLVEDMPSRDTERDS